MIEKYVPHDQQKDADFYERILEQRIGKLNSFTEPLAEDFSFHFQSDHYQRLRQSLHTSVIASPAVTRELAHLKFFRQPYPLLLSNYHNIDRRRRLNSHQLRLQPDHLFRLNNSCGTVESPKRENQGRSDLSHTILILNRFFVPSIDRVINSNKQQLVVAQFPPTFSFFRTSLPTFSFFLIRTRCLNATNSTLTVNGRYPILARYGPGHSAFD